MERDRDPRLRSSHDQQRAILREGVFDAQSLVIIAHAKLIRRLGSLLVTQLAEVERAVAKWLCLEFRNSKQTG